MAPRAAWSRSWLLDLTAAALHESPDLDEFAGPRLGLGRGPLDVDRRDRRRARRRPVLTTALY